MKGSSLGALRIAAAYIGTVVGAGFASGQEVLRFFTAYGSSGIWGAMISTALFFFFGYSALLMGKRLGARSHLEVVRFTSGKLLGSAIDALITIFLFGALAAMIAGAGAVTGEQFGLSPAWGMLFMAVVSFVTVITGVKGVASAISVMVPLLLAAVLYVFISNLINNPVTESDMQAARETVAGATPHWLLSAINYAAYNIVVAVAVLAPMGTEAKDDKALFRGALLGSLGLGAGVLMINYCLLSGIENTASLEVPMIFVASGISPAVRFLFAIVIFSEIYSTAAGNLFGFTQRVSSSGLLSKSFSLPLLAALCASGAIIAGQLGFSRLVRFLYPTVGYGALLFFAGIIRAWLSPKKASFLRRNKKPLS